MQENTYDSNGNKIKPSASHGDRLFIADWEWEVLERNLGESLFELFDFLWSNSHGYVPLSQYKKVSGKHPKANTWTQFLYRLGYKLNQLNLGIYIKGKPGRGSMLARHEKFRREEGDLETW